MMKSMNRILRGLVLKLGYDVVNVRTRENQFPPDFDDSCINLVREVRPFTMTSAERILRCEKASSTSSPTRFPATSSSAVSGEVAA